MRRPSTVRHAVATALLVSLFAAPGRAQPAKKAASATQGDYSYRFLDDVLAAGGIGVNDARILVASHVVRTTLIRPRTAFIVEMLKTVENL